MQKHYDVIIVGAGSMGMAAGYFLANQGVNSLLIDAFDPPHNQGSHHGDTRIIRHAYGEGKEYVPLALRAQQLWNDLEKKSHYKIFTQVGSMGLGKEGNSPFIDEAITSGNEYSLDIDKLFASELTARFPGLNLPNDYRGFYEPESGFLFSENSIRAYRELAGYHGASFSVNNSVENIVPHTGMVEVITTKGVFTAAKLIISGGAWTGKLISNLNLELPLVPSRQPVAWFEADESMFNMYSFPTFMAEVPNGEGNAIYYGFPSIKGSGLKIGRHEYVDAVDPDTMNREFGFHESDERHLREFLDRFMPKAAGRLKKGSICIYTRTPDGHFIVDRHPEHRNIFIAAGFSGHGYKFASVIGEILSQLAIADKTDHDISLFRINRKSLWSKQ